MGADHLFSRLSEPGRPLDIVLGRGRHDPPHTRWAGWTIPTGHTEDLPKLGFSAVLDGDVPIEATRRTKKRTRLRETKAHPQHLRKLVGGLAEYAVGFSEAPDHN